VTAGLKIRSAATKPAPPPTSEFCQHYFDEVSLAEPFELKMFDASTVTPVSTLCVDYDALLSDALSLTTVAVHAPTVLPFAHDPLIRSVCTFVPSTQSTDPVSFMSMLETILAKSTTIFLKGYEQYNQRNWDGYDAEPITPETLRYARRLLGVMPDAFFGLPDIAPSGDGSIGLEWVPDDGPLDRLFLDIGPGEEWIAYWKRRNGEFGRLPGTGFDPQTKRDLQKLFANLSLPDAALGW
jgi:hypothetical protein